MDNAGISEGVSTKGDDNTSVEEQTRNADAGCKPKCTDDELTELLDNALKDFDKTKSKAAAGASSSGSGTAAGIPVPATGDSSEFGDQAQMQKAASDFQLMLSQLAAVQKNVFEQMEQETRSDSKPDDDSRARDGAAASMMDPAQLLAGNEEIFSPEQAHAILSSIASLADKAGKVAGANDEEEFAREMEKLQQGDGEDANFMPFMAGLMATFLSKDMMYPPVKEMADKYPQYLEDNRDKLDAENLARYEKQLEIMQKVCREYETEVPEEDQQASMQQFENITQLMQQMQKLGFPPEELAGNMPPGWSFDQANGMPRLEDASAAAESCSIM